MTLARYDEDMHPVPTQVGAIQREGFGTAEIQRIGETSAIAVAAKEKAMVEARYVMALRQPRDWDMARQRLLKRCKSPSFAEKAIYAKPVGGGKVEGLSIRFVEEALRSAGNILVKPVVIFEDETRVIYNVSVTDLEANLTYESDVAVEKTVERSSVKPGQEVISSRQNSSGRTTYLIRANEDDMLNKLNARISKAIRNNGLRLIPGDIIEDAERAVRRTMRDHDAADPDAAKKAIIDAFGDIHVTVDGLKDYVGHDLGTLSPAEIDELRKIYTAVKVGEATWNEVLRQRREERDEPTADKHAPKVDSLKERLAQKAAAAQATPVAVQSATPPPEAAYSEQDDLAGLDQQIADGQATAAAPRGHRGNGLKGVRGL